MSGAGSTFGTHSPPLQDDEHMGVCNIRGDKAPSIPDSKQREREHTCPVTFDINSRVNSEYFQGSQSDSNTAAEFQSNVTSVRAPHVPRTISLQHLQGRENEEEGLGSLSKRIMCI